MFKYSSAFDLKLFENKRDQYGLIKKEAHEVNILWTSSNDEYNLFLFYIKSL